MDIVGDGASTDTGADVDMEPPVPERLAEELAHWQRTTCATCSRNSMFYCPFCCRPLGVPAGVAVPRVRLPFGRCDIIFDDAPKKATSIHAKVLAPGQVRFVDLFTNDTSTNRTLSRVQAAEGRGDAETETSVDAADMRVLREVPEYDPKASVVLFPDEGSVPFAELVEAGLFEVAPRDVTIILIDAPWKRAQTLRRHPQLANLRSVRLKAPPASRFWRYHSEGRGCVSTIEALAALAREVAEVAGAEAGRGGADEDPLLFFFLRQFAYIAAQAGALGAELPTDEACKARRSARGRQKDRTKPLRLRPMGEA